MTKYLKICAREITVSLNDIGEFKICILNALGSYLSPYIKSQLLLYQTSSVRPETLKLLEEEEEEALQNRDIGKDVLQGTRISQNIMPTEVK